jgi:peptide/nickel transport system substrate-binding protein
VRGLAGAGAATGIVTLAGCTPGSTPAATSAPAVPTAASGGAAAPATAPTAAPAARQPKRGGAYRIAVNTDSADMDIHQNVTAYLAIWGPALAYSKLLRFKADGTVRPLQLIVSGDLAESWQQADDTTYVFKVRPGVKFHNIAPVNGREVTAEDVKYSFERQISLRTNGSRLSGVTRIEAPDRATLRITLEKPDADFLTNLAHYHNKVVPRESVDVNGDLKQGPIIGSGPYVFEKWERNAIATLTRNPDYFERGKPYVDRVEFPRIADGATRLAAIRGQEADLLIGAGFTPRDAEVVRQAQPDILIDEEKGTNADALALNMNKPPFNDLRVRQAFAKAIDFKQLIDVVLNGKGWHYPGIYVPGPEYFLPESEVLALKRRDVAGARQLLAQAGVAPGTVFECYVSQARESCLDAAQVLQQQLGEVGIGLTLRPIDTATGTRIIFVEKVHQLYVGTQSPAVSTNGDLFVAFHSQGTQNRAAINDPKLDQMIEQQATMVRDPEGRKKLILDIQRYLIEQANQITFYGLFDQRMRWKYVQDYFFLGTTDEPLTTVWLDK